MKKALLSLAFLLVSIASANAQAPFYQNKTVTIVVGYLAGDGYDIWARLLAGAYGQTYSRQSQLHGGQHARRRVDDRG